MEQRASTVLPQRTLLPAIFSAVFQLMFAFGLLGSRRISPDGVMQLSEEASSGLRLAVVVNIVSVSVIT